MPRPRSGFTIFDALAVLVTITLITIITIAMGSGSRLCDSAASRLNLAALARAAAMYTADFGAYPPSYAVGADPHSIQWTLPQQPAPNLANGYVHWSGMFASLQYTATKGVFASPEVPRGGAPSANPGPFAQFWEAGQVNEFGAGPPAASPNDRQAKRLACTANRAIMPRNRLTPASTPRHDRLVGEAEIAKPASTILFAELLALAGSQPWQSVQDPASGVSRSHRPVMPFIGLSAGTDVYAEPHSSSFARFRYAAASELLPANQLGASMILESNSTTTLNAVARSPVDGGANFAFIDGSVRRFTIEQTLRYRLWGDRFYSISGNNSVQP